MAEHHLAETLESRTETGTESPRGKPQMLGKYRIEARLGKGGMGVVYQAEDTLLQRRVAIKVLPRRLSADPVALERFLFEARAAARLSHPNIVHVYEINEVQGGWFLVMELVSGGTTFDLLGKRGPLSCGESGAIVLDACRGLIAAHDQGLIHRDIKPANILLTRDGMAKIADFGLAKALDHERPGPTSPDTVLGTPAYMSPEQCRAQVLDARSDIYSLGCTFYTLLTGKAPFEFKAPIDVLYAHCNAPRPDPRQYQPSLPEEFVTLVHAAMAIAPGDRFGTAREMLQSLERILPRGENSTTGPVILPSSSAVPPPLPARKKAPPAEVPTEILPREPAPEPERPSARKTPRPTKRSKPDRPDRPEHTTRRWLLAGLFAVAGLGGLAWLGSRRPKLDEPSQVLSGDAPFWQRIDSGGVSFAAGGPVNAVAISPDLRWLAAASEQAGLSVWDLTTGEPVAGLQAIKPREQTRTLAFSPDSKTLVAGGMGRLLHIVPSIGQVVEARLPIPPSNSISCLTFSPDGEFLLVGRQGPDRVLADRHGAQLFLLRANQNTKEAMSGLYPSGSFLGAAFTPGGKEILALAQDGTVRAFTARTLTPVKIAGQEKSEAGQRGKAFAIAATPTLAQENYPSGPYFVVADEQGLFFRHIEDWAARVPFWPLDAGRGPRSVGYSPTSQFWAAGLNDGTILIRNNVRSRGTVFEVSGHKDTVRTVAFSSKGDLLVSGSDDRTVRITHIADAR